MSNACEGGVDLQRGPEQLPCPLTPPRGLRVGIRGEVAAVRPWEDVLFEVQQEQVSAWRSPGGRPGAGSPSPGRDPDPSPAVKKWSGDTGERTVELGRGDAAWR